MTITNGYCTEGAVTREVFRTGTPTADDLARVHDAINAGARMIDRRCGRRFWQDSQVTAREFYADDYCELTSNPLQVLDISTTTGLIVALDEADTGTFSTTLTINTDFILLPANAADDVPVQPYTTIRLVNGHRFPMSSSGRPGARVTGKHGWPAVPDDINRANVIQAVQLFKSADAPFGGLSFGDGTSLRIRSGLNPVAEALVAPYALARVA